MFDSLGDTFGIKPVDSEQNNSLLEKSENLVRMMFGDESNHVDTSKLSFVDKALLMQLKRANYALSNAIDRDKTCRFSLRQAENELKEAFAEVEALVTHVSR